MILRGVDVTVVKELLDHTDIQSTMIYVTLSEADIREEYRRAMRPDWQPGEDKGPVTPPQCPQCSIVRVPGYTRCPACGYNYAREGEFGEEYDEETR